MHEIDKKILQIPQKSLNQAKKLWQIGFPEMQPLRGEVGFGA